MSELEGRALHFIGIGGAGMSGLALACAAQGARVSGSDRAESTYLERLRAAGLDPGLGHDPEAVPAEAEVVVSTAIDEDNPELARARERDQRVVHRGELLAELCATRRLIAIAGAHGKTTTAGMIAQMLNEAGVGASFLLGGELPGVGPDGAATNVHWGEGEWLVAEADESDGSFLRLRPEIAVITNVELDHHSHWAGEGALLDAFAEFAASARGVVTPTDPRLDRTLADREVLRFAVDGSAVDGSAALVAGPIDARSGGSELTLGGSALDGEELRVRLAVPGRHNVANALAAIGGLLLARQADPEGLPELGTLCDALARFPGMARRLERRGEVSGVIVYDDYAHHPTELAASLAALREQPHRRLIAIFQPHLYSRTRALAARFGRALAAADEIGVLEIYPARERPVGELAGISGLEVAQAAADAAPGRPIWWLRGIDAAAEAIRPRLEAGDLLVTLGAGDVHLLADRLLDQGGGGGDG